MEPDYTPPIGIEGQGCSCSLPKPICTGLGCKSSIPIAPQRFPLLRSIARVPSILTLRHQGICLIPWLVMPLLYIHSESWHPVHNFPISTLILATEIVWRSRLTKSNAHFFVFIYLTSLIMYSHQKTRTPIFPGSPPVGGVGKCSIP